MKELPIQSVETGTAIIWSNHNATYLRKNYFEKKYIEKERILKEIEAGKSLDEIKRMVGGEDD